MNTKEAIIEILDELCPGVDCESSNELIDARVIDSLTMVAFVAELEDVFDIAIPPVEVVADNFNSVDAISALVSRLSDEEND